MHSMNQEVRRVIGGVDSHADTHQAAALDERGRLLGSKSFAVSATGYRELLQLLDGAERYLAGQEFELAGVEREIVSLDDSL